MYDKVWQTVSPVVAGCVTRCGKVYNEVWQSVSPGVGGLCKVWQICIMCGKVCSQGWQGVAKCIIRVLQNVSPGLAGCVRQCGKASNKVWQSV